MPEKLVIGSGSQTAGPEVQAPGQLTVLVDAGLGNSSYIVDVGDGRALALDPSRDPSPYLALAERRGLVIAFSVETHLHADQRLGSSPSETVGERGLRRTVPAPDTSD